MNPYLFTDLQKSLLMSYRPSDPINATVYREVTNVANVSSSSPTMGSKIKGGRRRRSSGGATKSLTGHTITNSLNIG